MKASFIPRSMDLRVPETSAAPFPPRQCYYLNCRALPNQRISQLDGVFKVPLPSTARPGGQHPCRGPGGAKTGPYLLTYRQDCRLSRCAELAEGLRAPPLLIQVNCHS